MGADPRKATVSQVEDNIVYQGTGREIKYIYRAVAARHSADADSANALATFMAAHYQRL